MKTLMVRFLREEQGQDLVEYSLLLAFVALASAALFISSGQSISKVWSATSTQMSQAASAAVS
jgi:Flp pilus assembly pilin Flp